MNTRNKTAPAVLKVVARITLVEFKKKSQLKTESTGTFSHFHAESKALPPATHQIVNLREDFSLRGFPHGRKDKSRLTPVGRAKLLMNGAPMAFQCPGRNSQFGGDGLVGRTSTGGFQDFLLPL
jgi:hypothetical protein